MFLNMSYSMKSFFISMFIVNLIIINAMPQQSASEESQQSIPNNDLFIPSQRSPDSQYNQPAGYPSYDVREKSNYPAAPLGSSESSGDQYNYEPTRQLDQQQQQQQSIPQYYYDNIQNKVFTYAADGRPIIVDQHGNHMHQPYVISQPNEDGSYVIQTGYGGYAAAVTVPPPPPPLLSTQLAETYASQFPTGLTDIPIIGNIIRTLSGVFPPGTFRFLMNTGNMIISTLTMLLFGGALTTAICSFTPLCSISFAASAGPLLGLLGLRDASAITEKLGIDLTPDRVQRAAEFVRSAIEKYNSIQPHDDSDNLDGSSSSNFNE